jgi:hypothetical protein
MRLCSHCSIAPERLCKTHVDAGAALAPTMPT